MEGVLDSDKVMRIPIVKNGWPWVIGPVLAAAFTGWLCQWAGHSVTAYSLYVLGFILSAFMLFFHRDPLRVSPEGEGLVLAGADGLIRRVDHIKETAFLDEETVRISIFLSPFNVHVNRAPIKGCIKKLDYTPGQHLLTICNAASEVNEHSSILIEGDTIRCLVRQIVGPIVRRVVYWLEVGQEIVRGESIGMMRFGSRLDMYLPVSEVNVLVKKGDRVLAGVTVVAHIKKDVM